LGNTIELEIKLAEAQEIAKISYIYSAIRDSSFQLGYQLYNFGVGGILSFT